MQTMGQRISVALFVLGAAGMANATNIVTKADDLGILSLPYTQYYGHTFTTPLPSGLTAADTFFDDYAFVVPVGAAYNSFTATLNLESVLNISGLQARLYTGDLSQTTTGMVFSPQLLQAWSPAVSTGTGTMNVIAPIVLAPGAYILEVRGQVTGSAGGSYAGVMNMLSPVPEPASYALFGAGLLAVGQMIRRRTRRG
jgi:hypothetical protein